LWRQQFQKKSNLLMKIKGKTEKQLTLVLGLHREDNLQI
jgi:hypothetical protein